MSNQSTPIATEVQYRDIEGFPGYRIGSDGSVWTRKNNRHGLSSSWKRKATGVGYRGRKQITLYRNGEGYSFKVHRLVLLAFVGPCPDGMGCCHNDGNSANNNLTNLRWDTQIGNEADKVKHGTSNRGERQGSSKLTHDQVIEIRRKYARGGVLQRELGVEYGVAHTAISRIVNHVRWRHVS